MMRFAVLSSALCLLSAPLGAQSRAIALDDLASAPGVNATEIAWLRLHLTAEEQAQVLSLVDALSRPEAIQLLAGYLYLDGSAEQPSGIARAYVDSIAARPPADRAGAVRAAYLAARLRDTLRADRRHAGFYTLDFLGRSYVPARPLAPHLSQGTTIDLGFDFAPADTLLAIIGTPNISAADAQRRITSPVFDALIVHRSQSFYQVPLSREQLGIALSHAASTDPLDQLYRFAQPQGMFDYADVASHRDEFRATLETLRTYQADIFGRVTAAIAPYVPPGTHVVRHVALCFADGADGWGTDTVIALDLEWYKDDYGHLVNLLTHETFHAAQNAAMSGLPRSGPDSLVDEAMDAIYREGTATFVAPPKARTPAELARAAHEGARLFDSVAHASSATAARAAIDRGTFGAGPFYALGAAMSQVIVDVLGPQALAMTLRTRGPGFFAAYRAALAKRPTAPNYFWR